MKRLILIMLILLHGLIILAQDSVKVKNRHGIPDTTKDTIDMGVLIDTIHTSDSVKQQVRQMEVDATPESKIIELENSVSMFKASLKKYPDDARKDSVSSLENSIEDLKNRINETNDSRKRDRWEKDYSDLKLKIEQLKPKFP